MAWMDRMREGWHWALSTPIGQELAQRARARAEREMDRLAGRENQAEEPPVTDEQGGTERR